MKLNAAPTIPPALPGLVITGGNTGAEDLATWIDALGAITAFPAVSATADTKSIADKAPNTQPVYFFIRVSPEYRQIRTAFNSIPAIRL